MSTKSTFGLVAVFSPCEKLVKNTAMRGKNSNRISRLNISSFFAFVHDAELTDSPTDRPTHTHSHTHTIAQRRVVTRGTTASGNRTHTALNNTLTGFRCLFYSFCSRIVLHHHRHDDHNHQHRHCCYRSATFQSYAPKSHSRIVFNSQLAACNDS